MEQADEHIALGIAYTTTGMDDEAIAEFEKAVELYSGHEKAHYCLAKAYLDLMQFDLAWRHVRIAERLNFPVDRLIDKLGMISKEPPDAAVLPEEEMKREELEKHFRRGILCAEKSEFDEAMAEFRRVLKIAPKDGEVHHFLGSVYGEKARLELERGRSKIAGKFFKKAREHLKKAEEFGIDSSEILRRLKKYAGEEEEVKG